MRNQVGKDLMDRFVELESFLSLAVTWFQVKVEDDDMIFYIDNLETAQAIYGANLKLQMKDGWKVSLEWLDNRIVMWVRCCGT